MPMANILPRRGCFSPRGRRFSTACSPSLSTDRCRRERTFWKSLASVFRRGLARGSGGSRVIHFWWVSQNSRSPMESGFIPASPNRSEEHTSELQSLMRISYAVFCLKKKKTLKYQQQETENKQL